MIFIISIIGIDIRIRIMKKTKFLAKDPPRYWIPNYLDFWRLATVISWRNRWDEKLILKRNILITCRKSKVGIFFSFLDFNGKAEEHIFH